MENAKIPLQYALEVIEGLTEAEKETGYIKFNIPNPDDINSLNGEGVWGWVYPEDKELYDDDNFYGLIPAILCNNPMYYGDQLEYGVVVQLKCNGPNRPIINPGWVRSHMIGWDDDMDHAE